jgi:hypothetical protein
LCVFNYYYIDKSLIIDIPIIIIANFHILQLIKYFLNKKENDSDYSGIINPNNTILIMESKTTKDGCTAYEKYYKIYKTIEGAIKN